MFCVVLSFLLAGAGARTLYTMEKTREARRRSLCGMSECTSGEVRQAERSEFAGLEAAEGVERWGRSEGSAIGRKSDMDSSKA